MKVLVGGIYHESHSFSNIPTDLESFKRVLFFEGNEVIEKLRGTTSEMAGFIRGAERFDFELVPTVWAWGVSSGPVKASALESLLESVRKAIGRERVDGILFALHGALVGEDAPDGDGLILSRLRSYVGDRTPIAITLDLHANVSEQMVSLADVVVGYDTYPHVDQVERGLEAAELLVRTIKGEIRPVMALEKPPLMIVPQKQLTDAYPMNELVDLAHEREREVLSVTVSGGFVYSDVPEVGLSAIAITDNRPELARRCAKEIADRAWELRRAFVPRLPGVRESVERAIKSDRRPVILADIGDNIGAGTPGDGTFILRELLHQDARAAVVIIADPEAVGSAIEVGVGQELTLAVGGKCDRFHGEPVAITGRVKLISDGRFVNRGPMRDGILENMGRTVVVQASGVTIVLTEIKMPPWNLEQLRSLAIPPEDQKIIVLKSAVAFRAAYESLAQEIIEVNSPGLSSLDLSQFNYQHIRRPIFPLDEL